MDIQFEQVIPILRIFDVAKADEFYLGFLGFKVDWEHRFDDNAPLYRQISRDGLVFQLSEHHGDGGPGARSRDDEGRRSLPPRDFVERLSLYASRPREDGMGHARDRCDRSVREHDPVL
jgi:Glyoxalase superfamily protein